MDLDTLLEKNPEMFLLFRIADQRYAIDAMSVIRISDYRESFDFPNTRCVFNEVVEMDGVMVPLFKLDQLLMTECDLKPKTLVIRGADESERFAFYIDEALETISLQSSGIIIRPMPEIFDDDLLTEIIRHCIIRGNEIVPIIELYRLLG